MLASGVAVTVMKFVDVSVTRLVVVHEDVVEAWLPKVGRAVSVCMLKAPVPVGANGPLVSLPAGNGMPVPDGRIPEPVPWW